MSHYTMLYKLVSVREILQNKVGMIYLYFEAKLIKSVFHSLLVRDDYSQLGPTGLVGSLSSHIQRAPVE